MWICEVQPLPRHVSRALLSCYIEINLEALNMKIVYLLCCVISMAFQVSVSLNVYGYSQNISCTDLSHAILQRPVVIQNLDFCSILSLHWFIITNMFGVCVPLVFLSFDYQIK